jgi:hypothetical protein
MVGQVEGLGESSMMIPREEGMEVLGCSVNEGMLERSTTGFEGDVLGFEEREAAVGSLNSNPVQLEVGGAGLKSSMVPCSWNLFMDLEESLGLDRGVIWVDSSPGPDGSVVRAQEGGFLRDNISGGGDHVIYSDVSSTPSQEVCFVKQTNRRGHKKQTSKNSRPPLPMVSAPLSKMIAMSSMPVGRCKKNGEAVKKGVQKGPSIEGVAQAATMARVDDSGQREEDQEFELEVVLPFHDSGINLLIGQNGVEDRISEGEEVEKLMEIQRKVGFTFNGRDQIFKEKLVELEG